ncbi:MAG: selenide, water dikinase SelD [Termitinemataceae bacterium]|nr:MAG: selenide, water dikinase SelD [Termitinemataceae bacterium]
MKLMQLTKTKQQSLLSNCTSGGCGAKIESDALAGMLSSLPKNCDKNLLVGYDTSDDAAVYSLDTTAGGNGSHSLICTTDFFPPMVDEPRTFGRIAATNALSDIYAMGGRPLLALNLVCFPQTMDKAILAEILAGGAEKIAEAGAVLGGGHSIYDSEPKYGLSVTGIVESAHVIRNNTPKIGHQLILTKPLGVGIVMAALRVKMSETAAVSRAIASMERLNRYACECMSGFTVSAATDVTGFGLIVHALEMAGSAASIRLYPDALPFIPQAIDYANEYLLTAAGQRNRNRAEHSACIGALPFAMQELLFDPQTSGGLLIAVDREQAVELTKRIKMCGDEYAAIIGEIISKEEKSIVLG